MLAGRVAGCDDGAQRHAADPTRQGEQQGLSEELDADVAAVAPIARRRPISPLRSKTDMTMTLAIPTPPTSRATAPSPRNSEEKAFFASMRACRASEGWLTCTSLGLAGLTVAGGTSVTACT